jgi:MtN3 and saliva related transmembrane protein
MMGEWMGWIAGTCTTFAFLPQLFRIIQCRSAKAVSWLMYSISALGISLWIIYGMYRQDRVLVFFNCITLSFVLAILIAKWYFDSKDAHSSQ